MMIKSIATLCLAAACTLPASAGTFYTTPRLLTMSKGSDAERTLVLGFVAGVFDSHHALTHCAPNDVILGDVYDLSLKVLRRFQSEPIEPNVLLAKAFSMKWPCAAAPTS